MPLIKRRSKKAFEHNLKAEMHAGKPQDQALAIAYSVKRRAKKAKGGEVNESARTERRPIPQERDNDAMEVSRNNHKKALIDSNVLDQPELRQARKGLKTTKIKHPRMVPNSPFTSRLRDEEDDLQDSAAPCYPEEQPPKHMNEEGADRQGPESKDLHMKMMAHGGMSGSHDEDAAEHADLESHVSREYGAGPEEDEVEHPAGLEEDDDQMRLPVDEYMASHFAKGGKVDQENEHEHIGYYHKNIGIGHNPKTNKYHTFQNNKPIGDHKSEKEARAHAERLHNQIKFAEGGMAHEMDDQPEEEEAMLEHASSVAAAVMARRKRRMMAEGGEILDHDDADDIHSHDSIYSDDSDQADLSRNADEDANEEDQLSWNALRKENYSESDGLELMDSPSNSNLHGDDREEDAENDHDRSLVSRIRSKMKRRSPITR